MKFQVFCSTLAQDLKYSKSKNDSDSYSYLKAKSKTRPTQKC